MTQPSELILRMLFIFLIGLELCIPSIVYTIAFMFDIQAKIQFNYDPEINRHICFLLVIIPPICWYDIRM
jgi:hypothetical protein